MSGTVGNPSTPSVSADASGPSAQRQHSLPPDAKEFVPQAFLEKKSAPAPRPAPRVREHGALLRLRVFITNVTLTPEAFEFELPELLVALEGYISSGGSLDAIISIIDDYRAKVEKFQAAGRELINNLPMHWNFPRRFSVPPPPIRADMPAKDPSQRRRRTWSNTCKSQRGFYRG